jgi:hypothetical protein
MNTYLDRMSEEHQELSLKIKKLTDFLYGTSTERTGVDYAEVLLMRKQLGYMLDYADTLEARLVGEY